MAPSDSGACPASHRAPGMAEPPFSAPTAFKSCTEVKAILPSLCSMGQFFPVPVPPPFPGEAAFHGPCIPPGCQGTPGGEGSSGRGRERVGKGSPIPSHPRGVAGAPEPLKEAHYAPGPRPANTSGCTWKSSAAGSASASVAERPEPE